QHPYVRSSGVCHKDPGPPVGTPSRLGRAPRRKGQVLARIGHRAAPKSQPFPGRLSLAVHLLEALAFVPQVEHSVVVEFRPTQGVSNRQILKPFRKLITLNNHCRPPTRHLIQVVLSTDNLNYEFINSK